MYMRERDVLMCLYRYVLINMCDIGFAYVSSAPIPRPPPYGAVEFVYRFCLCSQCGHCCALDPLRYCARLRTRA